MSMKKNNYSTEYLIQNFEKPLIINIKKYNDKSFIIYGKGTILLKQSLKELGGRYNPKLKDVDTKIGWIFPMENLVMIESYMKILIDETSSKNTIVPLKENFDTYSLLIKNIDQNNYFEILNKVNHKF